MNAEAPPFPLQIPYTTCVLAYSSFVNIRDILSNMYLQENSATISEIIGELRIGYSDDSSVH